ncbi:uncharacterized protein LOC118195944 [Stegodyphus dumicola]|uniref:uncharacterized protein LOC118195944 n=1 Tax=Stegodyphus dumicola TaxID=202533 RepID=UPI0015B2BD03|nr:uncharacterized protein LOC118195944 [Stegodyphus dumicola]
MQEVQHQQNSSPAESISTERQHSNVIFSDALEPSRRKSVLSESTPEGESRLSFIDDLESRNDHFSEIGKLCEKHANSIVLLGHPFKKKNNGKEISKDNLSEALLKLKYKFLKTELKDIIDLDIVDEVLHCLHITFIYVVRNYFGSPGPKSVDIKELSKYTHILLHEDSKSTKDCLKKACAIKSPHFILNLEIIEAVGLDPLKNARFSFCKVWLKSDPYTVELSEFVEYSPHPSWKAKFTFEIENWKTDVLYIEIWCSDSECCVVTHNLAKYVASSGVGKFCCCFFNSNKKAENPDFIGETNVRLSNIFSEGVVQWLLLSSPNSKSEKGRLLIATKFAVPYFKTRLSAFKRHLLILKICMQESVKVEDNQGKEINSWELLLNSSALTVVFLHSVISNITVCENVVCRFLIANHIILKNDQISYQFLYSILSETGSCVKQAECMECSLEECLEEVYIQEVKILHKECFTFISELHAFDLVREKRKCEEFEYSLRIIYLCEDITDIISAPLMILKSEARNWYEMKAKEILEIDHENKTQYLIQFLDYIIRFQMTVDNIVRKVLQEKSYTGLTYDLLDNALYEPLMLCVKEISSELKDTKPAVDMDTKIEEQLHLFMKMKELLHYLLKFSQEPASSIQLYEFRDWFGLKVINNWFKWKQVCVEKAIKDILATDDLENKLTAYGGKFSKQSKSVTLTIELIENSLIELWRIVSQPRSDKLDFIFLNALHECCFKYANIILDKAKSYSYEDSFVKSGKIALSVSANNLWSLSVFAEKATNETVGKSLSRCAETTLALRTAVVRFCRDIAEREVDFIIPMINDVVRASFESDEQSALEVYENFVNKLLWDEASIAMTFEVFSIFQVEFWNAIIKLISKLLNTEEAHSKCSILIRFSAILEVTENIFFADSRANLTESLWTEEYKELKFKIQQMLLNS